MRALVLTVPLLALLAAPLPAQRIKMKEKRPELEARLQTDSLDPAAHYNLALALWNEKKWDDAERELKAALALDPRLAPARLALGYLPYARNPKLWDAFELERVPDDVRPVIEAARREERHAYLIDPLVNTAIIGAATPKKSAFWSSDEGTQEYYDTFYQGYDDYNAGDYVSAYRRFDQLVELYRDSFNRDLRKVPEVWLWGRARAAAQVQKWDVAERDLQALYAKSLEEEKKDELKHLPLRTNEFRYLIAMVQARGGKSGIAEQTLREVAKEDIGLYMAHVRVADIAEAERRFDDAVGARKRAVEANPDDPTLLTDLGLTLGRAGRFDEAMAALEAAHEANPRDPRTMLLLGLGHLQLGRQPEAKAMLQKYVSCAPSRYEAQVVAAKQRLASMP